MNNNVTGAPAPEAPRPVEAHTEHQEESVIEAPPTRPSFFRMVLISGVAIGVFVVLGLAGRYARARQITVRDETSAATTGNRPRVLTIRVERAPAQVVQVLPGSASPLLETAVYARTSGYLKRRLVDIGDMVTEGQLLAEIETPEVDGQLLQARAALAESKATVERNKANEALAKVNVTRTRPLVRTNAVTQQEADEAEAALQVATASVGVSEATVTANQANVRRLEDLQRFQKVTAPFAGVVTARNFDSGALIVADNANARELFHLASVDTLRVFADIPQTFASSVHSGQLAPVFRPETPGREFPGTISRTTHAVDPRTRTLRVQVDVPNADGALLPGMYLQVRFRLDVPTGVMRVPGAAVVTRAEGTKVAVLDSTGAIHYRPVQVGRDFGTTVEILSGLTGGETLVVRPGDDLPEGTLVEVAGATR
ncbi:efflux RND transporter periplasmic adaptor subunit [Zavarzinella formosa]|uniref:efflux RND transporter periplasmic adaptor subunit n=1 Tax=Zavarzinella formosa TaxID=360055 RepID=UPI0002DBF0E6|nr:efflux RND transporter periplasmic adaptor subunit [Zavarzinella formosa]